MQNTFKFLKYLRKIFEKKSKIFFSHTLWPKPLIQFNPSFEIAGDIDTIIKQGIVNDRTICFFRIKTLYTSKRGFEAWQEQKHSYYIRNGMVVSRLHLSVQFLTIFLIFKQTKRY